MWKSSLDGFAAFPCVLVSVAAASTSVDWSTALARAPLMPLAALFVLVILAAGRERGELLSFDPERAVTVDVVVPALGAAAWQRSDDGWTARVDVRAVEQGRRPVAGPERAWLRLRGEGSPPPERRLRVRGYFSRRAGVSQPEPVAAGRLGAQREEPGADRADGRSAGVGPSGRRRTAAASPAPARRGAGAWRPAGPGARVRRRPAGAARVAHRPPSGRPVSPACRFGSARRAPPERLLVESPVRSRAASRRSARSRCCSSMAASSVHGHRCSGRR